MEMNASSVDVCRLCAESYDSRSFIPLYTDDKSERNVARQINKLFVNLVSPDDGLPQQICLKCSKNVEMCYSFISNVIETQNRLKRLKQVADQNMKRAAMNEGLMENNRLENVATKDCDNRINKRSVSNLNLYYRTSNGIAERSNTTAKHALNGDIAVETSSGSHRTKNSFDLSRPAQTQRHDSVATCLFRCGVCLEKFASKVECIRHMSSSHTPPSSLNTTTSGDKTVAFEVVCKNVSDRGNDNETVKSVVVVGDDAIQTKQKRLSEKPVEEMTKPRRPRKTLMIDSFHKEVKKKCSRYECDKCGRLMVSWFAFKRHLSQHGEADENADGNAVDKAAKKSAPIRPLIGYCKKCKKLVKHFRRHNMFHDILKLESSNQEVRKFLCS